MDHFAGLLPTSGQEHPNYTSVATVLILKYTAYYTSRVMHASAKTYTHSTPLSHLLQLERSTPRLNLRIWRRPQSKAAQADDDAMKTLLKCVYEFVFWGQAIHPIRSPANRSAVYS